MVSGTIVTLCRLIVEKCTFSVEFLQYRKILEGLPSLQSRTFVIPVLSPENDYSRTLLELCLQSVQQLLRDLSLCLHRPVGLSLGTDSQRKQNLAPGSLLGDITTLTMSLGQCP